MEKVVHDAEELTDQQLAAIDLLAQGAPPGRVVAKPEIDPSKLYRWRQQEPFKAERKRRRRVIADGAVDRLIALFDGSIGVCTQDVAGDDGDKAIAIVRFLGGCADPQARAGEAGRRGILRRGRVKSIQGECAEVFA